MPEVTSTLSTFGSTSSSLLRRVQLGEHDAWSTFARLYGDGKDDVGVVRKGADGFLRWFQNLDNDPTEDLPVFIFGLNGDRPVAGDWNGDNKTDAGVVRSGAADGLLRWYFDTNRNPTAEREIKYGFAGDVPVVGDWKLPEIHIEGGGHGFMGPIDFGTLVVGSGVRATRTFVIHNTGTAPLRLGMPTLPEGYRITNGIPGTLAPGEKNLLTVEMLSETGGNKAGEIVIPNSDGNEDPYRIAVRGDVYVPMTGPGIGAPKSPITPTPVVTPTPTPVVNPTPTPTAGSGASGSKSSGGTAILGGGSGSSSSSGVSIGGGSTGASSKPPVEVVFGSNAAPTNSGLFRIYNGYQRITRVEINRPYGRVPFGTAFVIDTYAADGTKQQAFVNGTLSRLELYLSNKAQIVNNAGISVTLFVNGTKV